MEDQRTLTKSQTGDSKSTASPHEYGKGAGVVGGNSERVKEGEKSQGKSPGNKGATGVVKNVGTLADDEKPHNEAKDAAKKTHSNGMRMSRHKDVNMEVCTDTSNSE